MSNFHGAAKKHGYFEGWYFKQTGEDGTVAFIPSYHVNEEGKKWAALQLVTESGVYSEDFTIEEFCAAQSRFLVELGSCRFSRSGCRLKMKTKEISATGILNYENMTKPKYDIMGPFALVPFMECRHKVISLYHKVSGQLEINGKKYQFQDGSGYIEGDRGRAFPASYLWTQCCFRGGSIMLSIAEIPFLGKTFPGCIGFLFLHGKEYRIATYLGAKVVKISRAEVCAEQGSLQIRVRILEENAKPLKAPKNGVMSRVIHESPACRVHYEVRKKGAILFEHISSTAGFEWAVEERMLTE